MREANAVFQTDADASKGRPDKYSRSELALRVAEALVRADEAESLVLALDGPWGSGKSWLIDRVTKVLENGEAGAPAKVVHFNPWLIGEESALILDFLVQVALELSAVDAATDKAKKTASSLLRYAKVLGYGRHLKYLPIPVVNDIGRALDAAHEEWGDKAEAASKALEEGKESRPSLLQARDEARATVRNLEQRLVVVIDDIDRLRAKEIRAVMQLVKAVADFPNTSFLLSMDSEQVARALVEKYDPSEGYRYLQKIVQLSVTVPPIDLGDAVRDVRLRFEKLNNSLSHQLKPYEQNLLNEALGHVARLCNTPRDVVRWANHLGWSARGLSGSINLADLCVAEALQQKLGASVWRDVINSLGADLDDGDDLGAELSARTSSLVGKSKFAKQESIASQLGPGSELEAVRWLFPAFANETKQLSLNSLVQRRLKARSNLQHYRRFRANRNEVTGRELDNWFQNPSEFEQVLGNSRAVFTQDELIRLTSIGKLLEYEQMPSDLDRLRPLIVATQRCAESEFGQTGVPNSTSVQVLVELFLALQARPSLELEPLAKELHLPELVEVLEQLNRIASDRGNQPEAKSKAAEKLLTILKPGVLQRLSAAVDDKTLIGMRANLYMLHALPRLDSLAAASRAMAHLTEKSGDLAKLMAQVAELSDAYWEVVPVPLIELSSDPQAFVEAIDALEGAKFQVLKAAYQRLSEEQLSQLAQRHALESKLEHSRSLKGEANPENSCS